MAENLGKKKDKKKKLEISSETLAELDKVSGGAAEVGGDCTCGGCYCTYDNTSCPCPS